MDALRRFVCGDSIMDMFDNTRRGPASQHSESGSTNTDTPEAGEPQVQAPVDSHTSKLEEEDTEGASNEFTEQDKHIVEHTEETADQLCKPPVAALDLEMFQYPEDGRYGDTGTAMTLTEGFVWEVNLILRCENKIARYTEDLKHVEKQIHDVGERISGLQQQIMELAPDEQVERSAKEKLLEYGTNLSTTLNEKRDTLAKKLDTVRDEMKEPKKDFYRCLKRVFGKYNLLEDISGASDSGEAPSNEASHQKQATPEPPKTPTESETQRAAEQEARYAAYDQKEELDGRVFNLRQRLDHWYLEYEDTLRDYKQALARGDTDDTRTIFDNHMFCVQQDIVQDLVVSERELQEAIDAARALGIVFGGSDQESKFQDYADDGYRISHEQEWIQDLDRSKIEKWVQGLPDDEPPSPLEAPEGDADEWDVRNVDFGESISVIAEGKPRVRIDRWRSTLKQEHFARFDGHVDTEGEHPHSHQKRRCRRTNTL